MKNNKIINKESNPIAKTFGTFKFLKSTAEILLNGDKECWDE